MKGPPINHSFSLLNPHPLSGASSGGRPPSPGARTSRFLDARTNGQRDCSSTLYIEYTDENRMNRNSTLIPTAIVFFGFEVVWYSLGSQNNKITETWSASVKNSLRHHQWLVSKKDRQHKKELKMV